MSDEQKEKIAASKRGKPRPQAVRDKISATMQGVPLSEERKANLRGIPRNHTYKEHPPEARERMRERAQARVHQPHTQETRDSISKAHRGREKTPEHRANISAASKRHLEVCVDRSCKNFCHPWNQAGYRDTWIERILVSILLRDFPDVRRWKHFGHFEVDAYLPAPYHIAFEADGEYWHRDTAHDMARDAELMRRFALPVVRVTEAELEAMDPKRTVRETIETYGAA